MESTAQLPIRYFGDDLINIVSYCADYYPGQYHREGNTLLFIHPGLLSVKEQHRQQHYDYYVIYYTKKQLCHYIDRKINSIIKDERQNYEISQGEHQKNKRPFFSLYICEIR